MRRLARLLPLGAALLAGAAVFAAGAASAQDRELTLRVKPRSWLDAGTEVEVGSKQNYMYDTAGHRDFARFGARGAQVSSGPLRPGEGIPFNTPQWWSVR